MYIEPRTNIRILSGVPLDTTYEHTLSWEDNSTGKQAQTDYFLSCTKYNLTNYNYIRVSNGIARVAIEAENLYDCNYLMFQNTAFGNKWFYAFVTEIVYLNNGASEIHFTIDDLQTWYFEFKIDDCFIERETTATDVIGEHIEPEPVSTGEYKYHEYTALTNFSFPMAVIIMIAYQATAEMSSGNLYDSAFSGADYFACKITSGDNPETNGVNALRKWLNNYRGQPDAIINMYQIPLNFLNPDTASIFPDNTIAKLDMSRLGTGGITFLTKLAPNDDLDGYIPKNKKLYTYPYNFYTVYGGNSTMTVRYEYFNDIEQPQLEYETTLTYPPTATIFPSQYKGASQYLNESLTINNFPTCSWDIDAYTAYMAQQSIPNIIKLGTSGINSFMQIGAGNVAGGVTSAISSIGAITSEMYSASIQADLYNGNYSNGSVLQAHGLNNFYGGRTTVNNNQARIIDNFFTKYGYQVAVVKKPELRSRPHFNYIKTVSCTATGNIPSDSMKNICHIFDNGITFWKNPTEVGNYSVDNKV